MTMDEKRLARLLKHRLLLERIEEGSFAAVRQATARRERALDANERRRIQLYELGGSDPGPVDASTAQGRSAYSVRVGRDISSSAAALAAGRQEEAARRDVLLARRRDRMAIEALMERRRLAEKVAARRTQLQRDDEWAARNWIAGNDSRREQR
jgi:flagellar export protein FliJ